MLTKATIAFLRQAADRTRKHDLQPHAIRSILLVELARLGDAITILPSIPLVRSHFPNATVRIVVDQEYADLFNAFELEAEICGFANTHTTTGLWNAIQVIRGYGTDLACSMSPPKRNAAVVLASGARYKVGYLTYTDTLTPYLASTPVESYGFDMKMSQSFGFENISARPMKVMKALGIETVGSSDQVRLKNDLLKRTRSSLSAWGIIPSAPYVVIHPFSGWEYRNWPTERFSVLAQHILEDRLQSVVFLCNQKEDALLKPMRNMFEGSDRVVFFPSANLAETAVVIGEASLFIGNDSGPLHLASALGIRTVGLYGPASPELTGPVGLNGAHFKRVECSPCDQRKCVRPENPCMHLIALEEVAASVRRVGMAINPITSHA